MVLWTGRRHLLQQWWTFEAWSTVDIWFQIVASPVISYRLYTFLFFSFWCWWQWSTSLDSDILLFLYHCGIISCVYTLSFLCMCVFFHSLVTYILLWLYRHLTKLHEAVSSILPETQVQDLYRTVNKTFKDKLRDQLMKMNVVNNGGPQHG
jgi:hypothetical protein